ncbi:MAG: hypothetical protein HZA78_00610 [Candidatus Schekmanbacteria bacterium]|nr:hypothetical protein [Candidatus Schekmanbacteria bacterium]
MKSTGLLEKVSKKYSLSQEEFAREAMRLTLKERKRGYMLERLDILRRYGAESVRDIAEGIKTGKIMEHPGWEDLIEVKNLDKEIKEIENDLKSLQKA